MVAIESLVLYSSKAFVSPGASSSDTKRELLSANRLEARKTVLLRMTINAINYGILYNASQATNILAGYIAKLSKTENIYSPIIGFAPVFFDYKLICNF